MGGNLLVIILEVEEVSWTRTPHSSLLNNKIQRQLTFDGGIRQESANVYLNVISVVGALLILGLLFGKRADKT